MALCGNPDTNKTALFSQLTGQGHRTGDRPVTGGGGQGVFCSRGRSFLLMEIPGSYSLYAPGEEAFRDFVCFGGAEAFLVFCDAGNMRRSLILTLQILEITGRVLICVHPCDEARGAGTEVDTAALSRLLGVPVFGLPARGGEGIKQLTEALDSLRTTSAQPVVLTGHVQMALAPLCAYLCGQPLPPEWLARVLTEGDETLCASLAVRLCLDPRADLELERQTEEARHTLETAGISRPGLGVMAATALEERAERLCRAAVREPRG
jgi:ferrous iron transport protein B